MAPRIATIADLAHDPATVAARLDAWRRGDRAEAVADTLGVASRSAFTRAYTAWVWTGTTPDGSPAWVLPIAAPDVERFAPAGTMTVLLRSLRAAAMCGARVAGIRAHDWEGFTLVRAPGLDAALAAIALDEAHPAPARARTAALPEGIRPDGPALDLHGAAPDARGAVAVLARGLRAHPLPVALALLEQGWTLEEASYPDDVADLLAHRGLRGPAPDPEAPSLAISDDPCPLRRHARRVLRRLLHARKVGPGHHTEFDHLSRGAAPEDRAEALRVGEALLRAGLLGEKPSVGQRHVYLRREALPRIHALIDRGETDDPALAAVWTAPSPGAAR